MVGPRPSTSEYRRSFKESFFRCSSRTYEDNLCYRTGRRQAEHDHNAEVFIWDTDSSDSASSCGDLPRPASLPTHKLKHQKLIESYAKRLNKTQDIQVNVPDKHSALAVNRSPECSPVKLKNGVDLNANKPKSGTQKVAVCSREQQTSDPELSPSVSRSVQVSPSPETTIPKRPKKPSPVLVDSQKKFVPKAKSFPAEVGRPLKREDRIKSPFLSYGCEDKELVTGTKKTHNVRASADIHASALRALQRRSAELERLEREGRKSPYNQRNKKALFNDFNEWMKRETNGWDTEYRRCFVGYDPRTYERILSSRNNPGKHWAGERLIASA